jgi:hypothetical protein
VTAAGRHQEESPFGPDCVHNSWATRQSRNEGFTRIVQRSLASLAICRSNLNDLSDRTGLIHVAYTRSQCWHVTLHSPPPRISRNRCCQKKLGYVERTLYRGVISKRDRNRDLNDTNLGHFRLFPEFLIKFHTEATYHCSTFLICARRNTRLRASPIHPMPRQ